MKYIVLETDAGLELPIIFPELLTHKDVADRLQGMPDLRGSKVIAGGFATTGPYGPLCHGESVSLNVKSRGAIDDMLLKHMPTF